MRKWRRRLAVGLAVLTQKICRLLRRSGGSTLPGTLALLIDPQILSVLAGMVRREIIVTMGTNGKTTVNNILLHTLKAQGMKVVANSSGSNMSGGVASAFVLAADRKGRLDADYACIEVDEFAAPSILPALRPGCVILTNIFRDQLDRFGEPDIVADRIRQALVCVPDARLVLNCDDIFSAALISRCPNPVITCGISEQIFDGAARGQVRDSIFCRFCGKKLEYQFFHYGQLGIWRCPGCGWRRPRPDREAEHIRRWRERGEEQVPDGPEVAGKTGYCFDIGGTTIRSRTDSTCNVYNILSAWAALEAVGTSPAQAKRALEDFDFGNHREESFQIGPSRVRLFLAKNPVGFQHRISLLCQDGEAADLVICMGDAAQDGKDISWLWDVDFGYLKSAGIKTILVTGSRRHDMALRLKYEEISCQQARTMAGSVKRLLREGTGRIYIIVNYSGLLRTNRMLRKMADRSRRHPPVGFAKRPQA